MTKITATKIGEVWCCADDAGKCTECVFDCPYILFVETNQVKCQIGVCSYMKEMRCSNPDSIHIKEVCPYKFEDFQLCDYWSVDE